MVSWASAGGSSVEGLDLILSLKDSRHMYENRRWSIPHMKVQRDIHEFAADVPIGNTGPTVVYGKIYNTPGDNGLNKPKGRVVELPGKYTWRGEIF